MLSCISCSWFILSGNNKFIRNVFVYKRVHLFYYKSKQNGKKAYLQINDPRNKLFVSKYDRVWCRKLIFSEQLLRRSYYIELSKIKTFSYNIVVFLYISYNPINACNTRSVILFLRCWFTYFDVHANTAYT